METLLFLDLDNTIFRTARRAQGELGKVAALSAEGLPASFMSPQQLAIFERISQGAQIIPTTGRTSKAFGRVTVPFDGHAICSHGGIILKANGEPFPEWLEIISSQVDQFDTAFETAAEHLRRRSRSICNRISNRVVSDFGLKMYLTANHPEMNSPELNQLKSELSKNLPEDFWLQHNGSELALLPKFISKTSAVGFLKKRWGTEDILTIGFGDSEGDAGFLSECDYVLLPSVSQLGHFLKTLNHEL